jgi:hypothetical protein
MTEIEKIQRFVWKKCGSPMIENCNSSVEILKDKGFIKFKIDVDIGLAHILVAVKGCSSIDVDYHLSFLFHSIDFRYYDRARQQWRSPNWILLKKTGNEALFKDQLEETQIAIAELLGWVNE